MVIAGCGSSSSSPGSTDPSDEADRSTLPAAPELFTQYPLQFPNGVAEDLASFGIFNLTSGCDIVHYGWDFAPSWGSYPDDKVPVVAVADGIVTDIIPRSTNTYQGQDHNTWVVFLAVAQEVDVQYTFEPFIAFDSEAYSQQWLNVSEGDAVAAGDVIGYLPKVSGNIGEDLIHIDWKIATGPSQDDFVCPTAYFSQDWQDTNLSLLTAKIQSQCAQVCNE